MTAALALLDTLCQTGALGSDYASNACTVKTAYIEICCKASFLPMLMLGQTEKRFGCTVSNHCFLKVVRPCSEIDCPFLLVAAS
jgi:hypothetical protein